MSETTHGTLAVGEPHPAAYSAREWIAAQPTSSLYLWLESFSSCAIEGNKLGEVCAETLQRLLRAAPVSDRYLLGLAWTMQQGIPKKAKKKKGKK